MTDRDTASSAEKHAALESALPMPLDDAQKEEVQYTPEEMRHWLRGWLDEHGEDYNIPMADLERLRRFAALYEETDFDDAAAAKVFRKEFATWYDLFENSSPYIEVRAITDFIDREEPCNTFRVWLIGLTLACLGSGLNTLLGYRMPSIYVPSLVAQFVGYFLGKWMEKLPAARVNVGLFSFELNPGPFNVKENVLITTMANVSFGESYYHFVLPAQSLRLFYGDHTGMNGWYQVIGSSAVQMIGFGAAGIARKFLVYPRAMLWPGNMSTIALARALFNEDATDARNEHLPGPFGTWWQISRRRIFYWITLAAFVWFFFPDYLFQALSFFSFISWMAPNNVNLAMMTGMQSGIGLNPFPTFDWNVATTLFEPIVVPLWAVLQQYMGMVFLALVIITPLVYSGKWHSDYISPFDTGTYDRFGATYNVSRIIDRSTMTLNETAYREYSGAYVSAGLAVVWAAYFASYTAIISHTALFHHREMARSFRMLFKRTSAGFTDRINREMRKYPEVPEWWFLTILVLSIIAAIVTSEVFHTELPVWAIFFCVLFCVVMLIPTGVVAAYASVTTGYNVIGELIAGYALPGRPVANMLFKAYAVISMDQAVSYISDLKMAHYCYIPPRTVFWAQTVATFVSSLVSVGVVDWSIANIPDFCDKHQHAHFSCPGPRVFFSASVLWGLIAPARTFGNHGTYRNTQWAFLAGALAPVIVYVLSRRWPIVRRFNVPVFIIGMLGFVPYNLAYGTAALYPALLFGWWIRRRFPNWWERYAYVISAALSLGTALSGLLIFFAFQYKDIQVHWWGNDIITKGLDAAGVTLKTPGDGESFADF